MTDKNTADRRTLDELLELSTGLGILLLPVSAMVVPGLLLFVVLPRPCWRSRSSSSRRSSCRPSSSPADSCGSHRCKIDGGDGRCGNRSPYEHGRARARPGARAGGARAAGLLEQLPDAVLDLGDTTLRRWAPDRDHRRAAQNADGA